MRTVSPGILSCSSILAPDVNIRAVKDTTSALLPSSCSIYTIFPVPSDHLPTAVSSLQYHLKAFSFLHPSQQPLSGPGILPPSSCRSTHVHTWFPAFFIGELAYAREHRKPLWKTCGVLRAEELEFQLSSPPSRSFHQEGMTVLPGCLPDGERSCRCWGMLTA